MSGTTLDSYNTSAAASPTGQNSQTRYQSNEPLPSATNGHVAVDQSARKRHQRVVLADPVALMYLEEDPSTTLLHRRTRLQGYEIYIVEQWACSRVHPTLIITTYTGDPTHLIYVGVLGVPTDRDSWSPRLKLYFDAVQQYHAVAKETPLGTLMVTNLSAFPSALTVIAVPDGDTRKNRDHFIVNENLKRLGCAGRASLKLQEPSPVVAAKFHQLYKTSDRVPLYVAVTELVKQCQLALTIFGKLAPEYADGLLCDVTEKALGDWWADIGTDLYNIEPSDGILGPTTVAALLGTLMGARNRLHAVGAPVPKDVFDLSSMKRGIGSFQKSQKLERTRRLDRDTLDRLHRVSQKPTNSERWAGAVKSTVAELSGKGGEMVMGMVGREKGGISDIETLDLERFVQLVHGERARWLWQGKPRKSSLNSGLDSASRPEDLVFTTDDQGSYIWAGRKRSAGLDSGAERVSQDNDSTKRLQEPATVVEEKDSNLGRIVSRSLTEKVSDARAGFGRFKDAVGLPSRRSHQYQNHHRHRLKEFINPDISDTAVGEDDIENEVATVDQKDFGHTPGKNIDAQQIDRPKKAPQDSDFSIPSSKSSNVKVVPPEIHVVPDSPPHSEMDKRSLSPIPAQHEETIAGESEEQEDETKELELTKTRSTEVLSEQDASEGTVFRCLRRSQSFPGERTDYSTFARKGKWPRHLSFSTVEEVIFVWDGFDTVTTTEWDKEPSKSLDDAILRECILLSDAQTFSSGVLDLNRQTVPWVEKQVTSVELLHRKTSTLQEELGYLYPERLEEIQELRERINQLFGDEGSRLTEEMKKIELLGAKLDYELNVLESKIEDVEEGLQDFQRNVDVVENRIKGLVRGEQKNGTSWFSWAGRKFGRL
ncbi:Sin3 complex subunit (Stb2), putative [Talaromyces stipitatus ATCC 10500]|uniref:Sin3 complex subunit (Stb2), putative n=1 Tax=Talaromyces stipitatus (strain ATCC 10500 / CBS 375.48 / QM 6759 / NRRL 1006) TaxID=441959 RepID=B8MGQ6_TALSN|nr:Sin3 complex subunit (Stb2), putative [Talaromyces stipitatus ATCC 10500]EED16807.1 Sin3 complex subunit (Stb2), putative [Talaromyces stipitatus ATCC 10500]